LSRPQRRVKISEPSRRVHYQAAIVNPPAKVTSAQQVLNKLRVFVKQPLNFPAQRSGVVKSL
jgi:hypothetical protein